MARKTKKIFFWKIKILTNSSGHGVVAVDTTTLPVRQITENIFVKKIKMLSNVCGHRIHAVDTTICLARTTFRNLDVEEKNFGSKLKCAKTVLGIT